MQDIRVFVTSMGGEEPLLKDIEKKYLCGIEVEGVMRLADLAKKLKVKYDPDLPENTIRNVLSRLLTNRSSSSSSTR